jgi:hypothetical protein
MKVPRKSIVLLLCLGSITSTVMGQREPVQPTSASELLAQISSTFSRSKPVSHVRITGTATWYSGGDTGSGPVTFIASANGKNSMQLQLSGGSRAEEQSALGDDRTCSWTDKNGVVHEVSETNCWTTLIWFLPQLSIQPNSLPASLGIQYLGIQTSDQGTFYSLRNQLIIGPGQTPSTVTAQIQQRSTTELHVDPSTFQPRALSYTLRPDSGSGADIDVEVHYDHYQQISGLMVPTHIERYLNGNLQLSIDIAQVLAENTPDSNN